MKISLLDTKKLRTVISPMHSFEVAIQRCYSFVISMVLLSCYYFIMSLLCWPHLVMDPLRFHYLMIVLLGCRSSVVTLFDIYLLNGPSYLSKRLVLCNATCITHFPISSLIVPMLSQFTNLNKCELFCI